MFILITPLKCVVTEVTGILETNDSSRSATIKVREVTASYEVVAFEPQIRGAGRRSRTYGTDGTAGH
jgi:hypothetical protein